MLAVIIGHLRVLTMLERVGNHVLAWELAAFVELKRLANDMTYAYTIESAIAETRKARLALGASAFEWAWQNAYDAIVIFEWKGAFEEPEYNEACEILRVAEAEIPTMRLADLGTGAADAARGYLDHRTHDRLATSAISNRGPEQWRRLIVPGPRPRLSDRIE